MAMVPGKLSAELGRAERSLANLASGYPETTEDQPWGHRAFKVRGRVFLFLASESERLSLSVKLPSSHMMALTLPFATPTGYGLGKSGWVSAAFARGDDVPIGLIAEWIDESYRAIAPKKLSALAEPVGSVPAKPAAKKKKPAAKKKSAAKKMPAAKKKSAAKKMPAAKRRP